MAPAAGSLRAPAALAPVFDARGWAPFAYQLETWDAHAAGASGLVHAPTGAGKTLAVFLGPCLDALARLGDQRPGPPTRRADAHPLEVLWITPLRALATDTTAALQDAATTLALPWTVEKRTGDTPSALRAKQRDRLPTVLVTTPESLSVALSHADAHRRLARVRSVVVDEWHELLGSKRGVQTQLALARLRAWNPDLRVWGLSATLGNLDEALAALVGPDHPPEGARLVTGNQPKDLVIDTVLPGDMDRLPWSGHLGLNLLDDVLDALERCDGSTLLFTNTRSQTELWFKAIAEARPGWIGTIAIHHGSLEREARDRVEDALRAGRLRCVVCTSSLDLGVDYTPVDQVIQVGSPKGVARLLQRAGRSGHQPGRTSRVLGVPAHAFELVEFAAARRAAERRAVESRRPLRKPLDVLVQHLVTVAAGGGFRPDELLPELRATHAYADLTTTELQWCVDFVTRGGAALGAYPQFHRVAVDEATGRHTIASQRLARLHRLAIGTISGDESLRVRFVNGRSLGSIEESFIARLAPGQRFVFAGRVLELVRVRDMTAQVKRATSRKGAVPSWQGGKSPISTLLAGAVRQLLDEARRGEFRDPELRAVAPVLELQAATSVIPAPDQLLVEVHRTRDGHHAMLFPFEGRLAHEGLGALLAHRVTARSPRSVTVTVNDYGIELLSDEPLGLEGEPAWRGLLSTDDLLPDLLACLRTSPLARRHFRSIARIAGLIHPGYPGEAKRTRHLQASSELFFDVFEEFDPANLLLDQAKRETLDQQLEIARVRTALERITSMEIVERSPERLTPLAFPLWAESLRAQQISSESWAQRVRKMAESVERATPQHAGTRA
jgi:ATP-dependent Lhr-like helicase